MKVREIFENLSRRTLLKSLPTAIFFKYHKPSYASQKNYDHDQLKIKNRKIFEREFVKKVLDELIEEYKIQYKINLTEKIKKLKIPEVKITYEADEKTVEGAIGIPVDTKKYPLNFYDYKNNTIYLAPDAKVNSLVHELVHFIQYNITHKNENFNDYMEQEAIKFQHSRDWDYLL